MEFSLFSLCTHADQNRTHREILGQMRTTVTMADQAGFDIAWFAEHHFSTYCIMPSPLVTVAHMAGHTKNIKLGPAVVVMPFYEPVRLIEEIFYVDQLTEGRFVLGLGTGYQPREFAKFDFEIEDRMERGMEIWDAFHQAQYSHVIDFQGEHIQLNNVELSIVPYQKPIPTFAVGNAPEVRKRMLERGVTPLCGLGSQPPEFLKTLRGLLSETAAELDINDSDVPFAVQRYVHVTENPNQARAAAEQVLYHARLVTNMRNDNPDMEGVFLNAPPFEKEPTVDEFLSYSLIGSAEHVAEKIISESTTYGITHLSAFFQFANMPYDQTLTSLESFCEHVMPVVKTALSK
jgi:alkanesulfonate monooxygenase SsuD/methylene tetrahydromethanopterin reductase-like flavin-dependent oxidoreductase (luciferase family)